MSSRGRRVSPWALMAILTMVASTASVVAHPQPVGTAVADECRAGNAAGARIVDRIGSIVGPYLGVRANHTMPGISLAVVGPTPGAPLTPTIAIVTCGETSVGGGVPVAADTLFEAGSETKTFTATALAQLVLAGRISLDDPVQAYVPAPYLVPDQPCPGPARTMTIRDLANYNSGLQDLPANRTWSSAGNPEGRANYTRTDLWESFDHGWAMPCDALLFTPGTGYSYSDWGFALLGTILADLYAPNPGGVPNYARLVDDLVIGPLGLTHTALEPIPPSPLLASPTCAPNASTPCAFNNVNAFAGAGGLVSDIGDMAAFVAANLGFSPNPAVLPALRLTHVATGHGAACATCTGLAWAITPPTHVNALSAFPVLDKDGGTNGMHSHTYLVPDACWGLTILSNSNTPRPVGSFGIAGEVVRALAPTSVCPVPESAAVGPRFVG